MPSVSLVTQFLPYVDEMFATESKKSLLTNQDLTWTGAHTVKVYKISTSAMGDYGRSGPDEGNWSRYGSVGGLDATTEEFTLRKDRSFTFAIDKLDKDETGDQLAAASALARQVREVVIPEVDTYVYAVMSDGAGLKPAAVVLTKDNIYDEITKASNALDNAEVPETGRVLLVTPDTYLLMKRCEDITMETDIGNDMRLKGVISNLDGCIVIKVPKNRLVPDFGFIMAHPCATVAPTKLEDYKIHQDPPGISGELVEGRLCYDAFVLDNKKKAIYFQAGQLTGLTVASSAGTASGDTAITVTETKGTGNVYKYKIDDDLTPVSYGMDVTSWTTWDGSADITAATDKIITLVEATSTYKAVKAGSATVVAHA